MAKQTFNEAESFLLRNWGEALVLEETMARARVKQQELFEKMGEAVLGGYPGCLDTFTGFFTQKWSDGQLYFGRKNWPSQYNCSAGLWLSPLGLDSLADAETEAPEAYIFVRPARKLAGLDVVAAKQKLWRELPKLLTAKEHDACLKHEEEKDFLVGWPFSSKQEILGWIIAGDEPKLTECIQDQVAIFVKLVPLLNDLLRSDKAEKSPPLTL